MFCLGQNYTEGMSREELDAKIAEEVAKVAPRWPDPSREEDAVQALRQQYIYSVFAEKPCKGYCKKKYDVEICLPVDQTG